MSLLSTASTWTNENDTPKKRTPSIGLKHLTSAVQTPLSETGSLFAATENANSRATAPVPNIEQLTQYNQSRNQRVHAVLENMAISEDNVGDKLGNFNPLPRPAMMKGNGMYPSTTDAKTTRPPDNVPAEEAFTPLQNDLQTPPPQINMQRNYAGVSPMPKIPSSYGTGQPRNHTQTPAYSNYHTVFQNASNRNPAKRTLSPERGEIDSRLLEKINYMIHLLEEQQLEKTNNVMEEFILYSLLGVFMIYVLDSFARAGKYVR